LNASRFGAVRCIQQLVFRRLGARGGRRPLVPDAVVVVGRCVVGLFSALRTRVAAGAVGAGRSVIFCRLMMVTFAFGIVTMLPGTVTSGPVVPVGHVFIGSRLVEGNSRGADVFFQWSRYVTGCLYCNGWGKSIRSNQGSSGAATNGNFGCVDAHLLA